MTHEAKDKVIFNNKSSRWSYGELMKRAARLDIPALAELFQRWVPHIDEAIIKRGRRLTAADVRRIRRQVLDHVCDQGVAFSSTAELERWIRRSASHQADLKAAGALLRRIVLADDPVGSGKCGGNLSPSPPCELEAWRFAREAKTRIGNRRESPPPPLKRIAAVLAGVGVAVSVIILVVASNTNAAREPMATLELVSNPSDTAQLLPVRKGQSLETAGGHGTVALLGNNRIGLAPETKLSFSAISETKLEVKLERGSLAGQLEQGKRGRVLDVQSGRIGVLIGAAKVAVTRVQDEVEVRIAMGSVEILHDGLSVESLRAPQIVRLGQTGRLTFVAVGDKSFQDVDALLHKNPKKAAFP